MPLAPARLLLVRHAEAEGSTQRLCGRAPGAPLTPHGRDQAAQLGGALAPLPLTALVSSPRTRTLETAAAIARHHDVAIRRDDAFDEVDFGRWTGRSFDELAADPAWARWNRHRVASRCPGGETIEDVRVRVVGGLARLARRAPGATTIVVTHAEIVRVALLEALGLSPDDWAQVDVDPASCSVLLVGSLTWEAVAINCRPGELALPAGPCGHGAGVTGDAPEVRRPAAARAAR